MTVEGSFGERAGATPRPLDVPRILDLLDQTLGEIGRRRHLFGWLRAPGAEEWIPVDAYYPGNRLVVICRDQHGDAERLIEALVPEHELRLLSLVTAEIIGDPDSTRAALERELSELGPAPPRPRGVPAEPGPNPVAQAVAALAQAPAVVQDPDPPRVGQSQQAARERAARFVAARLSTPVRRPSGQAPVRRHVSTPHRSAAMSRGATLAREAAVARAAQAPDKAPVRTAHGTLGALTAIALAAVLGAEVYFGVVRWALAGDHLLLAFGIALDTCARGLGTIAAGRAKDPPAGWRCVLGGSPFVAGFALYGPDGPVATDPAPLAGLVALCASGVLVIAVVFAALAA
jgi:hypothetical protein